MISENRLIRKKVNGVSVGSTRLTKCAECPCRERWGSVRIPLYSNGRIVDDTKYREVGFRGSKSSEVVFWGESPGAWEIKEGKPFVGDSGKEIESEFEKNGIDTSTMFFGNACRCMLMKKEMSAKVQREAMKCCRPATEHWLKTVKPKLIVCFGNVAMQQVTKMSGITDKRGQFFWSDEFNCWVFPTFHPAFCFRDQSKFALWRPDIAAAADFIKMGFKKKSVSADGAYTEVGDIGFLLEKSNITVGFDTESQGLDPADRNCVVICYSVSDDFNRGYTVRLLREAQKGEKADVTIKWPRLVGRKKVVVDVGVVKLPEYKNKLRQMKELLTRSDIKKFMMNGNHDISFCERLGIKREDIKSYVLDISLGAHLLDPDTYGNASLLDIQRAFVPHRADHKGAMDEYKEDMLSAPSNKLIVYAGADAASTLEAGSVIRQRLLDDEGKKLARYYAKFLHPVTTNVLYEIRKNGIKFDLQGLPLAVEEVVKYLTDKQKEALSFVPQKVLKAHAVKGLKLTRADLIIDILFSKNGFGLAPIGYTDGGKPSVGQALLKRLIDDADNISEDLDGFLTAYLDWAPFNKLHSTYLKGMTRFVKPDGRIHAQLSTTWTATGRTASRKPNLQNTPKRNKLVSDIIRSLFVAPPGKVLLSIDYSQSELRWIADRGRISKFREVFTKGGDIHTATAQGMFTKEQWDALLLDKVRFDEVRRRAKAVNFGLVYGMHGKGFRVYARDNYGVRMSLEEANAYRNWYLNDQYDDIPLWHEREINTARRKGFCRSPIGRIRMLPNINSEDFMSRSAAERLAINTPIQGISSDSTLLAALIARKPEVSDAIDAVIDDSGAKLVLFVHDELLVEADEDRYEEVARGLVQCFNEAVPARISRDFGYKMSVPLDSDISVGTKLSEMTKIKF